MGSKASEIIFSEQPHIPRRYQTVGLIASFDEASNLNLFRLFITSTTKKAMLDFIEYQKVKNGIQIDVEHLDTPPRQNIAKPLEPPTLPKLEDIKPFGGELPLPDDFSFGEGKINVGLSRWYIATPKPYKITYRIDPEIFNIKILSNSTHSYGLTGNNIFVNCKLSGLGDFKVHLKEKTWQYTWIERDQKSVSQGQPEAIFSHVPANSTGEWLVEVVGIALQSNYTITYERIVTN
jgi:hypothetical protein